MQSFSAQVSGQSFNKVIQTLDGVLLMSKTKDIKRADVPGGDKTSDIEARESEAVVLDQSTKRRQIAMKLIEKYHRVSEQIGDCEVPYDLLTLATEHLPKRQWETRLCSERQRLRTLIGQDLK